MFYHFGIQSELLVALQHRWLIPLLLDKGGSMRRGEGWIEMERRPEGWGIFWEENNQPALPKSDYENFSDGRCFSLLGVSVSKRMRSLDPATNVQQAGKPQRSLYKVQGEMLCLVLI